MAKRRELRALARQAGQTLTEYALILLLIALVAVAALTVLGTTLSSVLSEATSRMFTS